MASGHGVDKPNQAGHPNRQVGRSRWAEWRENRARSKMTWADLPGGSKYDPATASQDIYASPRTSDPNFQGDRPREHPYG